MKAPSSTLLHQVLFPPFRPSLIITLSSLIHRPRFDVARPDLCSEWHKALRPSDAGFRVLGLERLFYRRFTFEIPCWLWITLALRHPRKTGFSRFSDTDFRIMRLNDMFYLLTANGYDVSTTFAMEYMYDDGADMTLCRHDITINLNASNFDHLRTKFFQAIQEERSRARQRICSEDLLATIDDELHSIEANFNQIIDALNRKFRFCGYSHYEKVDYRDPTEFARARRRWAASAEGDDPMPQ